MVIFFENINIIAIDKVFLLITTPKSNPSKHYKHFRKAVTFAFRIILRTFVPDSGFGTYVMLTAMVILAKNCWDYLW